MVQFKAVFNFKAVYYVDLDKVPPINARLIILNCGGYNLELEMSTVKKRAGIYVRRKDLESPHYHVVIIDVFANVTKRILN